MADFHVRMHCAFVLWKEHKVVLSWTTRSNALLETVIEITLQICSQVSAVALAKLLEHGVTANDSRLQDIIVQGDQVSQLKAMNSNCRKLYNLSLYTI